MDKTARALAEIRRLTRIRVGLSTGELYTHYTRVTEMFNELDDRGVFRAVDEHAGYATPDEILGKNA